MSDPQEFWLSVLRSILKTRHRIDLDGFPAPELQHESGCSDSLAETGLEVFEQSHAESKMSIESDDNGRIVEADDKNALKDNEQAISEFHSCRDPNPAISRPVSLQPSERRLISQLLRTGFDDFISGVDCFSAAVVSRWLCRNNWEFRSLILELSEEITLDEVSTVGFKKLFEGVLDQCGSRTNIDIMVAKATSSRNPDQVWIFEDWLGRIRLVPKASTFSIGYEMPRFDIVALIYGPEHMMSGKSGRSLKEFSRHGHWRGRP